ncbi:MAG: hypothetical protein IIX23_02110 [Oscillospiraceae bacterium]|nr:hypothetical protein [Oscillospiraceae bacterium]
MSDCVQEFDNGCPDQTRSCLSIHTKKITDSCRDKDCIEDLRVYLTKSSQQLLDHAATAKVRCADLVYAYLDVEPVAFDRNHYCIDVTFYYRILADAVLGSCRPAALTGIAVFSKRVVLCGEESSAKIFTSQTRLGDRDGLSHYSANLPTAVVEVLDPMVLSSRVREACECRESNLVQIPASICDVFDEELVLCNETRRLYVSLGQFSIVRLERDAQLVVPMVEYSIPTKECCENPGCGEDPCEMFSRIPFPTEQFAPRNCDRQDCDCGCSG